MMMIWTWNVDEFSEEIKRINDFFPRDKKKVEA